jgi:hypothetical protein
VINTPANGGGVFWWKEADSHLAIKAIMKNFQTYQNARSTANLRHARLYGNAEIAGLAATDYFRTGGNNPTLSSRLTLNVIKSCIDTVASKIAKHKPRPNFLTDGGDWSLQRKAKKLNSFIQGVFYETRFYASSSSVFRDACIFGTGFIKFFKENGRVACERVLSEEIFVDSTEAVYGNPQSLFQKKLINRAILLERFPKFKAQISMAVNAATTSSDTMIADMVEVIEAWRLPSGPESGDGKHCIVIENATLFDEEWERHVFPFEAFTWTPPVVGYFGSGLAEELIGIQLEINKLLRQIQLSHHLLSTPKVFLENNSQVVSSHMNNDIGAIVRFTGTKPDIHSFQTVHPEIYMHLERLYNKAYEISGISVLSAQSKKPSGLDSGKALREFSDIESERFALVQQRYEELTLSCVTNQIVPLCRELAKEDGGYKVKSPNKKVVEQLDFKNLDLEDSTYVLQCFPTNFLPATPAGRLQSVQELMQAGLIDRELGLSLLDFPDLQSVMNLANAALDDIMLNIERIIEHGEYNAPEPMMNLQLAIKMGQASYLKAKTDKVPEDRLNLLRKWIDQAINMFQKSLPPVPPVGPQPIQMAPQTQSVVQG